MLILALDTTTRGGSCALVSGDAMVCEEAGDPEQSQATRLPGDLMRLLERAGVRLADVDVFAVATGPGSFTGLRIGIATMQGLALAGGKPLIGVSALDALASIGSVEADLHPSTDLGITLSAPKGQVATIHTWMDAWRGEVYAAAYVSGRDSEPPVVAKPEQLLCSIEEARSFFIGDGAATYRPLIVSALGDRARIANPAMPRLAGEIARLAMRDARAGKLPPPHVISPVYVRRPDAELAREKR